MTSKAKVHLARLREERGMGQAAAAERLGTTQSAVSRTERDANPRLDVLRRYVREVLGADLEVEATWPDGRRVALALGPDPGSWGGPVERYDSLEDFYRANPELAAGWGYVPGDRSRGTAPYGSDEIQRVYRGGSEGSALTPDDGYLITLAAPEAEFGPYWDKHDAPVVGSVAATSRNPPEILVLAAGVDLRPVSRALRRLQRPSLEEVGAVVERIARDAAVAGEAGAGT